MSFRREEVRRLAAAQRMLLWVMALTILVTCAYWSLSIFRQRYYWFAWRHPELFDRINTVLFRTQVVCYLLQLAAVVRIAIALGEGGWTVLYLLVQCLPGVSLIGLLILNHRAIDCLRGCRIRVGWFGAKRQDVEDYRPNDVVCPFCGEPLEEFSRTCPMCGKVLAERRGAGLRKFYQLERTTKPPELPDDPTPD